MLIGLDAVALYPNIFKEVAMASCREVAMKREVKIPHFNLLEATRLLVLVWSDETIRRSRIRNSS